MKSVVADDEFSGLSNNQLKALLHAQNAELLSTKAELQTNRLILEQLKLQILKLKRMQFGQRSERRAEQIEQLELWVEELETVEAQTHTDEHCHDSILPDTLAANHNALEVKRRREFPAHLPRETHVIEPIEHACPDCGEKLKTLGEDIS